MFLRNLSNIKRNFLCANKNLLLRGIIILLLSLSQKFLLCYRGTQEEGDFLERMEKKERQAYQGPQGPWVDQV